MEECKYKIKKNEMENLINDDLDLSSFDNESHNESDNDESNESCICYHAFFICYHALLGFYLC